MSTKQLKNERMMNPEKSSRAWDTAKRLCRQLKGQRVRLGIVGISIIIYIGLSIWNPMYSAIVIDHLWQSIQAAISKGTPFSITWENMGAELTQLSVQYFLTWIFYYLQSFLMASVAENLTLCGSGSRKNLTGCRCASLTRTKQVRSSAVSPVTWIRSPRSCRPAC